MKRSMELNGSLDCLPDYLVQTYLSYAVDAASDEGNGFGNPFGWHESEVVLTESEIRFMPVHWSLMAEAYRGGISIGSKDFFDHLIERGNLVFEKRWGKNDNLIELFDYQLGLGKLSEKNNNGRSWLEDMLISLGNRFSGNLVK